MAASLLSLALLVVFTTHYSGVRAQNYSLDTGANRTYPLPVQIVHDFPRGTWIENLAVRSNGQILATEELRPRIYQVDPFHERSPILVHEFSETASVLGIVEVYPDVFCVCTGNFSSKLLEGFGEAFIYKVDMRTFSAEPPQHANISRLATLPDAQALDGLTFLGKESGLLLVGDFLSGVVWSVDIEDGNVSLAINSTFTRSTGFGVNGLKYHAGHLFFTNSQQESLVKVTVNSKGEAVGSYNILAHGGFVPDDFAVDSNGDVYITSFSVGSNGIVFVPREGGNATYIAGMAGPTACAFGRTLTDWDVLYVSTSGGDYNYLTGGEVDVSGKILKVVVGRGAGDSVRLA